MIILNAFEISFKFVAVRRKNDRVTMEIQDLVSAGRDAFYTGASGSVRVA